MDQCRHHTREAATIYLADHGGREILKLDESCISNPKSRNFKLDWCPFRPCPSNLRFRDFGFEMQDSSNFKISAPCPGQYVVTDQGGKSSCLALS